MLGFLLHIQTTRPFGQVVLYSFILSGNVIFTLCAVEAILTDPVSFSKQ